METWARFVLYPEGNVKPLKSVYQGSDIVGFGSSLVVLQRMDQGLG